METGWAFGIASTDKSRSSGVGTLSGAQSTCQAAAQHLMQPSVPKSVVKIQEIHLKFGIAPSNHNKSGQLVRQMPQLLLSEALCISDQWKHVASLWSLSPRQLSACFLDF